MGGHTVVIGGGFAGISAAVALAEAGRPVLLIEKKSFLGGRTYSIPGRHTGGRVDNGQHILMGCYHHTFRLLERLGTREGVRLQENLRVPYRGPGGFRDTLQCPALPGPWHLLAGLFRMRSLGWRDGWAAIHFGLALKRPGAVHQSETVSELCRRLRQPEALRKRLWDPIALSALNEDLSSADARLFQAVLQSAFFSRAEDSKLALPVVPLGDLLGDKAIRFLEERNGKVWLGRSVTRLIVEGDAVSAVSVSSGETVECEACIAALPEVRLRSVVATSGLEDRLPLPDLGASPILSVYLEYDEPFTDECLCCLQDSTFEWIFHRSNFMNPGIHKRFCVCLVASAARRFQSWSREDLTRAAIDDIQNTYPESRGRMPTASLVFWEPRATFSATVENAGRRPGPQTPLANFFLAGDWTATGLPATIEGAVISGLRAAEKLLG
ncbi:MAG TPA: hydroxysqualene dehydroxylase HpnE [bacterium]|nr:hydroxysqualene dehydroxylase HpnE [bacterium]HOL93217.1 hydroxysqualene dehydroxylase HpnE [bacterium]HPP00842.1 hydroxysqualene dehydroxylase HpnE [bacterium]